MANLAIGRPFVLLGVANDRVGVPKGALVASEVPADDVRARLEQLADYVVERVEAGELPRLDLPDLHRANALYDERGNVFVGPNVRPLALDRRGGEAFMRVLLTLETALENLRDGVCTTKRGLFYQHEAKLPDDASQTQSDRALASLANVVRVRRKSLGFVEARRGTVWGPLVIRDGGQVFDLAQVGLGGHGVPRFTDDIEIVSSDAKHIVIIEKEAIAARLAQTRWWEATQSVMVCSGGFPSMSTREFVRKLIDTLRIPAVIFADGDPAGIRVAINFAHGSISTALETPWLACTELSWGGFHPSEIDRFCGTRDHIRLSESDQAAARMLLEHPSHVHVNARVREEVAILAERRIKVELDTLIHESRIEKYLQQKLFDGELIRL